MLFFIIAFTTSCSVSNSSKNNAKSTKSSTSKKSSKSSKNKNIEDFYKKQMNISYKDANNKELYAFIYEWYGVDYKLGGDTKKGIDCSAFVQKIYKTAYNKHIPRTTKEIHKKMNKKKISKLKEGDLVFFNLEGKKNSHVGIYLSNGYFAHASTSKGVIINNINQQWYKDRYSSGGSL